MLTKKVLQAEPYVEAALASSGKADGMLIRQFRFPEAYDVRETFTSTRHDSMRFLDRERVDALLKKYRTSEVHLGTWARRQDDETLFALVKEVSKADPNVAWTGYRILGTIQLNGYPFWTLELFAKLPGTSTPVYTGDVAPNVLPGKRDAR